MMITLIIEPPALNKYSEFIMQELERLIKIKESIYYLKNLKIYNLKYCAVTSVEMNHPECKDLDYTITVFVIE